MRICIVGHYGGNESFTDGQSVKVQSLYNALKKHLPNEKVDLVDTYYLNKTTLMFSLRFLHCLLFDKVFIFLPAARGRTILFKVFFYIKKILRKRVFHDCIAGSLDEEVLVHKNWIKYLNCFDSNWMESPQQVEKLKAIGITNTEYIPNFKSITPISIDEMRGIQYERPFKFCTFCRVEPRKGIEDALIAMKEINEVNPGTAELDVYGPIQPGQEDWFDRMQKEYNGLFNYCGVVNPNDSVDCLKEYLALLFPTRYFTEGMPGTIIDAMFAGIPVIARKWAWCDNMIKDGYNGIVYDFSNPRAIDQILNMKENCLKESFRYSECEVISKIISILTWGGH